MTDHPPLRLMRVLLITLLVVMAIFLLIPEAPLQSSAPAPSPDSGSGLAAAQPIPSR